MSAEQHCLWSLPLCRTGLLRLLADGHSGVERPCLYVVAYIEHATKLDLVAGIVRRGFTSKWLGEEDI